MHPTLKPNLVTHSYPNDHNNNLTKAHRVLLLIIGTYTTAAFISSLFLPANNKWILVFEGVIATIVAGPIFLLCAYTIYVMVAIRPRKLTRFLFSSVRQYITPGRLKHALPILVSFPFFTAAFTYFKSAIPFVNPYSWDERLAKLDLVIHGGVHPWEWIQPIIGYPLISSTINIFYHLWFLIIYATVYWLAFDIEKSVLRLRFLISFVLCWMILGNIAAGIFSSVGPCYYGLLLPGENPYKPLTDYLHQAGKEVPLWALEVQKMLWKDYEGQTAALGISAMPSLHVATSVLLALLGANLSRLAGITMTVFALIIMIGSVHLGWHYALDGYVGAVGAYIIWKTVGWALSNKKYHLSSGVIGEPAGLQLNLVATKNES